MSIFKKIDDYIEDVPTDMFEYAQGATDAADHIQKQLMGHALMHIYVPKPVFERWEYMIELAIRKPERREKCLLTLQEEMNGTKEVHLRGTEQAA